MVSTRSFISVFASLTLMLLTGCPRGPVLVPVEGVVMLDGAPLKGGPRCYVVFQPNTKKGNESPHEPMSTIDEKGKYTLATAGKPGATPGWYRVRVEAAEVIDPNNPYHTNWIAAERYANPQKSGLEVEVKEKDGNYELQVKAK